MSLHRPECARPWQSNPKLRLVIAAVVLSAFFIVLQVPPARVVAQSGDELFTGYVGPSKTVHIQSSSQPPALSSTDTARVQSLVQIHHLRGPATRASTDPATRLSRAPMEPTSPQPLGAPVADPASGNNFSFYVNTDLGAGAPASRTSLVGEPSVGNTGPLVFETGNWYAALSRDNGDSFSYVDPWSAFPSAYGGFCCDQSVLYEPSRDVMVWLLMYTGNSAGNIMRLAIATGQHDLANLQFHYFDFSPQAINFRSGDWYDYPYLAVSSNYLYISANVFRADDVTFDGTVVLRLPLDALASGTGFSYDGYKLDVALYFNATLTEGALDTMYWATHVDNRTMRVYTWPEGGSPSAANVSHTTFPATGSFVCPGPGGKDWCERADDRVMTGWVSNGILGFMWNAPQGTAGFGTFPYPYVQVLLVNASPMTLYGESVMSNSSYAFEYPAAAVNSRGHVAGAVFYGGGALNPTLGAFIWDDISPDPYPNPPTRWETYTAAASTQGPASDVWGDYVSAHQSYASNYARYLWIASGYVLTGNSSNGGSNSSARPRFLSFGRQRDNPLAVQLGPGMNLFFPWIAN